MVSKAADSAIKLRKSHGQPANDAVGTLSSKIDQLEKQIQAERFVSIKEKLLRNGKKVQCHVSHVVSAISKRDSLHTQENRINQMLSSRIDHPLFKFNAFSQVSGDKDLNNSLDVIFTASIKMPYIERLPPYTSWIFLDRNQRMAEDQSVVGRRRIYYDQHGSEALICSDSEEELTEPEEDKHEFTDAEDRILWMAFEEYGLTEEVLDAVSESVGGTRQEIQDRYKILREKNMERQDQESESSGDVESRIGISLEESLSTALDSFDNLFCRRCMQMFDCRLHGCSQPLIYPSEKQPVWFEHEEDRKPCSDQCYLRLKAEKILEGNEATTMEEGVLTLASSGAAELGNKSTATTLVEERCNSMNATPFPVEVAGCGGLNLNVPVAESLGKRKTINQSDKALSDLTLLTDDSQSSCKKQKKITDTDVVTAVNDYNRDLNVSACDEKCIIASECLNDSVERASNKPLLSGSTCPDEHGNVGDGPKDGMAEAEFNESSYFMNEHVEGMKSLSEWKPLEKELYLKGVEMFGRNSCLITRNLLSGLKTCMEVATYMHAGGASMPYRSNVPPNSLKNDNGNTDAECTDQEMPTRARLIRKRGKTRKFKYSWKSAGHPSIWKRIADGKNQSCKQYTPCGCQSMCGKQCPCLHNGTCCEKYCGCSKSCKNRFRGCHCAKSQCRSRQCPCFAAGRECDPDVCRNCWVSCGDGSLGEPPRRGDSQCGNMRLLLRQQQRILLAESDVAGWGAFLKNPVNKNDYLGEYTGELISHREADKRGKIYDRANSSFLFDLNDQYVLDAYRKGDKLKFANHSSNPNCYAKVMLVAGDHRVGIFAKEHIEASEELFYDYRYGPDQAPAWARKPESSKRDESAASQGRAKKHQSH
ncbi:histone-lysine N-methyltransferase EZA1 isoform X1 [Neltuma alba]|uniref:histone-lysine N-methyltransferase EZA1 isoform X1 n=1 Tax=Neltuma alba TaxID=207710 RepID=UPI0010A2DCA4|nr:histone-lysine N-methyltransferase EZA1-like isoform X1 [Prosopis alba]